MSFVALHRGTHTSLATDQAWLSAEDWTRSENARDLLSRLEQLSQTREAAMALALSQARAEGYAAGQAAGREQVLSTDAPLLWQRWEQAAHGAQADLHALRSALVGLSLQVVQHISEQLAPADVVAALARRASEQLLPPRAAVVRVHPQLADAVRAQLQNSSTGATLEVRADATLRWHDCEFDTPAGQLLAGLKAQLSHVAAVVEGAAR
jgi:type III secretion protein L